MLIKFINGIWNLEKVRMSTFNISQIFLCYYKFLYAIKITIQIKSVLEKISRHWNTLLDEREIEILNYYYRSGKHLNTIYMCKLYPTKNVK